MLVHAAAIVRLKCSFHCVYYLFIVIIPCFWAAKLLKSFEIRKFLSKISPFSFLISHFFCTFAAKINPHII